MPHRVIAFEPLVLAEIEVADDRHHTELVVTVENPLEAAQVIRAQAAVRVKSAVVPELLLRVALDGNWLVRGPATRSPGPCRRNSTFETQLGGSIGPQVDQPPSQYGPSHGGGAPPEAALTEPIMSG